MFSSFGLHSFPFHMHFHKKKKRMLVKLKVRGTGSTFVLFGTFLMSKVSDK